MHVSEPPRSADPPEIPASPPLPSHFLLPRKRSTGSANQMLGIINQNLWSEAFRHSAAITIRASPPSRFPAPSTVAMQPCARLSGLCGLAALVAGLVAISFLATHASAAADLCANEDCGEGTCAVDVDNDIPLCVCKDGLVFDDDHKTCVADPCTDGVCGLEASCTTLGPADFLCNCNKEGFAFNEADKTCFAPLARTTVALKATGYGLRDAFFLSPLPPEQASASGTMACGNLDIMLEGSTTITAVWNASNPTSPMDDAPSNAMCKSLSFYAESFCKEKLGFTIARPVKKGSSYPVTKKTVKGIKSLLSVGCEITMCENDCGTARCVVKEGQPQCQCPEGLVFNAAKKSCLDPSLPPRRAGAIVRFHAVAMARKHKSVANTADLWPRDLNAIPYIAWMNKPAGPLPEGAPGAGDTSFEAPRDVPTRGPRDADRDADDDEDAPEEAQPATPAPRRGRATAAAENKTAAKGGEPPRAAAKTRNLHPVKRSVWSFRENTIFVAACWFMKDELGPLLGKHGSPYWARLVRHLEQENPGWVRGMNALQKEWRNLVTMFKQIKKGQKASGKGAVCKPPWYPYMELF
ncbi:unnamed protein product [Closterium sp. Yama58-4]|nr:unnamed protein product [Closterium sp. Yama58-4]